MEQSLNLINSFLDKLFAYGPIWIYLILLSASFIENLFPPFPGDLFTLTAGALAASGRLNIFLVFMIVYLGGIASVMVIYYLGKRYGRDYFLKKNFRLFSAEDILRLEKWFRKKGALLLIFNRFIIGARSAVALVTGISRYSAAKTCLFVSISFWIFNGLLLFGSYIFVINIDTIIAYYRMYEKIVWPIIILIAVIYIILRLSRMRKNEKRA